MYLQQSSFLMSVVFSITRRKTKYGINIEIDNFNLHTDLVYQMS